MWYGDSKILGFKPLKQLQNHFSTKPLETGYVSRMAEFCHLQPESTPLKDQLAGVISIPWIGEKTHIILSHLSDALEQLGDKYGLWQIFLPKMMASSGSNCFDKLQALKFCQINEPSQDYMNALLNCKVAIIYGGYNSITDVLFSQTPSLVLLRSMQDLEQQNHISALVKSEAIDLILREEDQVNSFDLAKDLKKLLITSHRPQIIPNILGAKIAANYLYEIIKN